MNPSLKRRRLRVFRPVWDSGLTAAVAAAVMFFSSYLTCRGARQQDNGTVRCLTIDELEYTPSGYFPGECTVRISPRYEVSAEGLPIPVGRELDGRLEIRKSVAIDGELYRVTEIDWEGFSGHVFGAVSMPASIVTLGPLAFGSTSGRFHVPGSVDIIREYAFSDASGIILLDEGLRTIADNAFGGFTPGETFVGSHALILPSTLESIGRTVLGHSLTGNSDASFSEIQCLAAVPPEIEENGDGEADLYSEPGSYRKATLYVPDNAVEAYRIAPGWSKFEAIHPVSDSGIKTVTAGLPVTILVSEGTVIISCDDASPIPVKIYLPDGRMIYFGHERRIPLTPGMYIVRAGTVTAKISL